MPLLEIKNLKTFFKTKKGIVKAVNDVSYSLEPGKTYTNDWTITIS